MAMIGPLVERRVPVELAIGELFCVFVDALGKRRGNGNAPAATTMRPN